MSQSRSWNLNEREGRFAKTNIPEPVIHLELGMKQRDGQRVPVGHFRLDLEALSKAGFVTKRTPGGSSVYDVQIYRLGNGTFVLGVRQDQTTPIDAFSV